MSEVSIYWRDWTEKQLAVFQQDQGSSNHCAKFAAATALNLLYGSSLSGADLVAWLEERFLKGSFRFTILGNNHGSFVFQTGNLVRKLGLQHGLYPAVELKIGTPETLIDIIKDNNSIAIVSITYFENHEPVIAHGPKTTSSLGKTRWIGGHIMIPTAYDSNHKNLAGTSTPWGFISSWNGTDYLYWMTDDDFQHSWGRLSLFNLVKVTKKLP
jgi:hypothetical protein